MLSDLAAVASRRGSVKEARVFQALSDSLPGLVRDSQLLDGFEAAMKARCVARGYAWDEVVRIAYDEDTEDTTWICPVGSGWQPTLREAMHAAMDQPASPIAKASLETPDSPENR
jgi:hypothetical protein